MQDIIKISLRAIRITRGERRQETDFQTSLPEGIQQLIRAENRLLQKKKLVGIDWSLLSSPSYTHCFSLIGEKF